MKSHIYVQVYLNEISIPTPILPYLQDTPGNGTSFIAGLHISGYYGLEFSFFAVFSTALNNSVF